MGCDKAESDVAQSSSQGQTGIDPYCDTRPQFEFCEDFDTAELPGVFDEQSIENAEMTIDEEAASSLPRSLVVSVGADGHAFLRHAFEQAGKLRLFGMLYLESLGEGDVEIADFSLGEYRVGFGVSSDGTLWAYEGNTRLEGDGTIPIGKWASFRWDVNLYEDGTGTAKLRFGNDFVVNTDALTPPGDVEAPIVSTVGLSAATGAWTMRFDNLTVEVKELTP